jgi:hypothetical protein
MVAGVDDAKKDSQADRLLWINVRRSAGGNFADMILRIICFVACFCALMSVQGALVGAQAKGGSSSFHALTMHSGFPSVERHDSVKSIGSRGVRSHSRGHFGI